MSMNVLVGCERSGKVRDAFRKRGHNAWSCDLPGVEPAGEFRGFHIEGDVLDQLEGAPDGSGAWDMLIAHPPCTYLCNSGVRWLYEQELRWVKMIEGAVFFRHLLECGIGKVVLENPVMHGMAAAIVGRRQDQIIQPWQFGHGETKATGLWIRGDVPLLVPTDVVEGREQRIWKMSPGKDQSKNRSETYPGIADAMAEQWGSHTR